MSSYGGQEFNGAARVPSPMAETPSNLGNCTDLNSVCYNSFTEHGQMLGVAIACGRFLAFFMLSIYCPFVPKIGYIRWKGLKQAKRLTARIDSKHAGLALTV